MKEVRFLEIFRLFPLPLCAALLVGLVAPLVGAFLHVRRTSFYGIVLPQFGAAGVAFGYLLLPWWLAHIGLLGLDLTAAYEAPGKIAPYLLGWSLVFSFAGLGALALPAARTGSEVGRVAAGFALASAATILFAQESPTGAEFIEALIHGQMLAIGSTEFAALSAQCTLVLACLAWLGRDFLLVSFDRECAQVLGLRVRALELTLAALIGLCVSVGVMTVGPVLLFGQLVLPPLAARGLARSMPSFLALSSLFGFAAALLGIWLSFAEDWPLGAAIVAAMLPFLLVGWVAARLRS